MFLFKFFVEIVDGIFFLNKRKKNVAEMSFSASLFSSTKLEVSEMMSHSRLFHPDRSRANK